MKWQVFFYIRNIFYCFSLLISLIHDKWIGLQLFSNLLFLSLVVDLIKSAYLSIVSFNPFIFCYCFTLICKQYSIRFNYYINGRWQTSRTKWRWKPEVNMNSFGLQKHANYMVNKITFKIAFPILNMFAKYILLYYYSQNSFRGQIWNEIIMKSLNSLLFIIFIQWKTVSTIMSPESHFYHLLSDLPSLTSNLLQSKHYSSPVK